jgi:S1-C subfamily serine protease
VLTTTTLSTEELLDKVRHSVLRVRTTGCAQLATGSAWLSENGSVITNRHVVEGAHQVELTTWDGRDLEPSDVQVSSSYDIAELNGNWSDNVALEPLTIRRTRVEPGERIAIVGYPEGGVLDISTGVAVEYAPSPDPDDPLEVLKATTVVKPGNSGGPALDVHGRVVGVVFAEELAVDELLVIPIDTVLGIDPADFRPEPDCRTLEP